MGTALEGYVKGFYDESHDVGGKVVRQFGVRAFPTLLVLDAAGREVDEVRGRDPEEFVQELERIQQGKDTLPALFARLEANASDAEAAAELAGRLSMRRPAEAEKIVEAGLAHVAPEDAEARADLRLVQASLLTLRRRHDEALDVLARVLAELPGTEAAGNVGYALANLAYQAEPEKVLPLLERALEVAPEEARLRLARTRIFLHEQRLQALIREQAERAWDDGDALNRIAWDCYVRGWLTTDALEWAQRAVELTDRAPAVLDTLACLFFASGNVEAAVRTQAEALLGVTDGPMRDDLEENMARFQAVKRLREGREEPGDER